MKNLSDLRPCLANSKPALFHKWIESKYVINPIVQGQIGGQVSNNYALVEYAGGSIGVIIPEDIVFIDDIFSDYSFERKGEWHKHEINEYNAAFVEGEE